MKPLTSQQVDTIRQLIRQQGIRHADLQEDLLDHICCLVEEVMQREEDFYTSLNIVMGHFAPAGNIQFIEQEINYLINFKTFIMKKSFWVLTSLVLLSLFACMLLHGIALLRGETWPLLISIAFGNHYALCLLVLPFYWWQQQQATPANGWQVLQLTAGFLCSEALINAIFFKLMHMPGAMQLYVIAALLGMIYVPLYGIRQFRLAQV